MLGPAVLLLLMTGSAEAAAADCPGRDAIAAELQRLGTADAVARFGSPEVTVQGAKMRVAVRGPDGAVSGIREVVAPASCAERAQVAAVLMSAWVGAWHAGSFPDASRPAPSSSRASEVSPVLPMLAKPTPTTTVSPTTVVVDRASRPPMPASPGPAMVLAPPPLAVGTPARAKVPAPPARRALIEVAGFAGAVHDGDAGALGAGVQVGYRSSGSWGIDAALAAQDERERAMQPEVPGTAAYRGYSLGVGLNLRRQLGWLLGDLSLLPEVTLLTVEGRNLSPSRSATRWGAATEARLRVGASLGAWRPFVFAGSGYAWRGERLTVDGYAGQSIALSRWSFTLGLGIAYLFGQTK